MKTLYLILIIIIATSCYGKHEEDALKWIEISKKPIIVTGKVYNYNTSTTSYTLMSADCKFYRTNYIWLSLPDTIKPIQP